MVKAEWFAADKTRVMRSNERRRTPRLRCYGPVELRVQGFKGWHLQRGRIRNLCLDGCLIQSAAAMEYLPGDEIDLRFEVKGMTFRARAAVRSVLREGRMGVEILEISGRNRTQLMELLEELAGQES